MVVWGEISRGCVELCSCFLFELQPAADGFTSASGSAPLPVVRHHKYSGRR